MSIFIVFAILFFISALFTNFYRRKPEFSIQLKKNCLLTKHPIVFINGRKSIFYFLDYWNVIPDILGAHGYEVMTVHLPWRNQKARNEKIRNYISSLNKNKIKAHFVADPSCQTDLEFLSQIDNSTIQSCNLIKQLDSKKQKVSVEDLSPPKKNLQIYEFSKPKVEGRKLDKIFNSFGLKMHSFLNSGDTKLQPSLLGVPGFSEVNWLRDNYVNLAIDLAEKDFQKEP